MMRLDYSRFPEITNLEQPENVRLFKIEHMASHVPSAHLEVGGVRFVNIGIKSRDFAGVPSPSGRVGGARTIGLWGSCRSPSEYLGDGVERRHRVAVLHLCAKQYRHGFVTRRSL